jgi:hypothetical protein
VSNYPFEPSPPAQPSGQSPVRKFFGGPGLIVVVITLAVVAWFVVGFLTPEPVHKEGSINYNGVAEVMDIGMTPTKCFVYIKRDTGKETKQSMAKEDCRKFRVGDMINLENGQYVSTASSSYK